ncbi:hypothetical protein ZPAH1_orf00077 [Aeromonas phage ZPAH1]|nr:hypothetical protein ZPAH1_orf00077 [Aeromonas phage ZPAH1]
MIQIGSRAEIEGLSTLLGYNFVPNKDMDYDFIATDEEWTEYEELMMGRPVRVQSKNVRAFVVGDGKSRCCYHEAYIIEPGSSDDMVANYLGNEHGVIQNAPLGVLLAIKMAHRYKKNTRNFIKTMKTIHNLRDHGVVMNDIENQIYMKRQEETLNYGHPKLNVDKQSFFKDDIYTIDHDSIHEAIAVKDKPAYRNYMMDGEEVMTSKQKFFDCEEQTKLLGVYEEACVLALERSIIPFPGKLSPGQAFSMALEKVCTSITSGWFREYAWENYTKVIHIYDEQNKKGENYLSLFLKNEHILRPFGG